METRNVNVTLEKAKEWYKKGGDLKEVALQAFTEEELKCPDFRNILTFEDACAALGISTDCTSLLTNVLNIMQGHMKSYSRASVAMLKLNIIRQALNLGHEMDFKKGTIWYPYTPAILPNSSYCKDSYEVEVAKVKIGCDTFTLLGGSADYSGLAGLGLFHSYYGVGYSNAYVGFLGCATKETAQHMGKHFAKLIFEAKYGDTVDYKWV